MCIDQYIPIDDKKWANLAAVVNFPVLCGALNKGGAACNVGDQTHIFRDIKGMLYHRATK